MEVESSVIKYAKSMDEQNEPAGTLSRRRKRRIICFSVLGVLIFIILLIVIFAFTVFKAKRPITTVDSVSLSDLKFSLNPAGFRVMLNASLDVDLSIKNPNKVGFKYTESTAQLNYRGQQVGEVPIPAGKISAGETAPMNLTLTVMADRLISDSQFYSDVSGGQLPLGTRAKISGKVNVLNLFRIHVVSTTSCNFVLFLSNSSVGDQDCRYKTKL